MIDFNTDDLAALMRRVDTLGVELMAALLAERGALRERATTAITQAASTKQTLFDQLTVATRELREIAGVDATARLDDGSGRDRLRARIDAAGLLPLWQQTSDRLSQCALLNQHNGIVVSGYLNLQRNLLEILCGKSGGSPTYSALGQLDRNHGTAALARI